MDFAGIATLLGVPLAFLTGIFTISGDRSRLRRLERISALAEKLPAGEVRARAEELQILVLNQLIEREKPISIVRLEQQWRWRIPVGFVVFTLGYVGGAWTVFQAITVPHGPQFTDLLPLVGEGVLSLVALSVGALWLAQATRIRRAWRFARWEAEDARLEAARAQRNELEEKQPGGLRKLLNRLNV